MNPLFWIPCLILLSTGQVYLSIRSNGAIPSGWFLFGWSIWGWALWLSGLVPIWIIVSRHSKNLMFDVLAYDITIFLTWGVATGILTGSFQSYGAVQWAGVLLIAAGFFLLHTPIK